MTFYIECFFITLAASTIFAVGGLGSAIILIPILNFLGVSFDLAKMAGLFVNTITTSTASFMNFRKGLLDIKFTIPFIIMSALTAPLGTYAANILDVEYVKFFFALFLIFSSLMMFRKKHKTNNKETKSVALLITAGSFVGFTAGLLGIGGGVIIVPLLFYMGMSPVRIATSVSFMIPFSTLSAFFSYFAYVKIDWALIATVTVAALIGGFTGNYIMRNKMGTKNLKGFLAAVLILVAIKLLYGLL